MEGWDCLIGVHISVTGPKQETFYNKISFPFNMGQGITKAVLQSNYIRGMNSANLATKNHLKM